MRLKAQFGFTIIEMMVTVAVAVVLAVLAVPTFSDLIEKSRLRGATDDIVNLLNTSRANAVKLQQQINVSVSGTATWCAGAVAEAAPSVGTGTALTVAYGACDCTATSPVACQVNGQNALVSSSSYSGVTLSNVSNITYSGGSGGVIFDPKYGSAEDSTGALLATTPSITVNSKTLKFATKISVSPLGQTYVCTPSTSAFVAGYPSC